MSEWLIGMTCAAMLAAIARCLMPVGAVRQVGCLVCAMMLLCAILKPLTPRLSGLQTSNAATQVWNVQAELEQKEGQMLKTLIEQECGTYIVDKAAELGAVCNATVVCKQDENGLWLPNACRISGTLTAQQQALLEQNISAELGIAAQQQQYTGGG